MSKLAIRSVSIFSSRAAAPADFRPWFPLPCSMARPKMQLRKFLTLKNPAIQYLTARLGAVLTTASSRRAQALNLASIADNHDGSRGPGNRDGETFVDKCRSYRQ